MLNKATYTFYKTAERSDFVIRCSTFYVQCSMFIFSIKWKKFLSRSDRRFFSRRPRSLGAWWIRKKFDLHHQGQEYVGKTRHCRGKACPCPFFIRRTFLKRQPQGLPLQGCKISRNHFVFVTVQNFIHSSFFLDQTGFLSAGGVAR